MTEQKVDAALNPLIEAGFFAVEQDASEPLAEPERDASLEKRREDIEKRREESVNEETAFEQFAEAAVKHNWPKPAKLSPDRRKKLRARLDEHGPAGWRQMLDKAEASEWINTSFPLKFDWVVEPQNFRKVIEGNYDKRATGPPAAQGWN